MKLFQTAGSQSPGGVSNSGLSVVGHAPPLPPRARKRQDSTPPSLPPRELSPPPLPPRARRHLSETSLHGKQFNYVLQTYRNLFLLFE